ncbi:uncharacterized protein LOC111613956 [Centruroides sculpturatus]|uniref:uncharacterized protein LOC111613956 n=1 Tax=Centruroides sculpturatus TaxID=218467 RepID=UPI000C6CA2D8|nr:uncharacterized protein LOC111613956 [Centruroides sculpturatus]
MDLKTLSIKKRVVKSSLTRLREKILGNVDDSDSVQLDLYRSKLGAIANEVKEVFERLFDICKEDEIEQYIEESQIAQDSIDELILVIDRTNLKLENSNSISNVDKASGMSDLKLPKLTLPSFSGNFDEWLPFSDLFQAAITNNGKLSGAQKLQYLKCSLKGEALKIIQSLSICDRNFEIAWELLSQRYSWKRELVASLIKKILSLPTLNYENVAQILNIVDSTTECIRSLEALNFNIDEFSSILFMFIIQFKLDATTRGWWERSLKGDDIPPLNDLLEFLKGHVRTLQPTKTQTNKKFMPKVTSPSSQTKRQCACCKGDHALYKCTKFQKLKVQDRIELAKREGLCFNCLSKNHRVRNCTINVSCLNCKRRHNSLLCYGKERNSISKVDSESTPQTSLSSMNSSICPEMTKETICKSICASHCEGGSRKNVNNQVLLCTAQIKVLNSNNEWVEC